MVHSLPSDVLFDINIFGEGAFYCLNYVCGCSILLSAVLAVFLISLTSVFFSDIVVLFPELWRSAPTSDYGTARELQIQRGVCKYSLWWSYSHPGWYSFSWYLPHFRSGFESKCRQFLSLSWGETRVGRENPPVQTPWHVDTKDIFSWLLVKWLGNNWFKSVRLSVSKTLTLPVILVYIWYSVHVCCVVKHVQMPSLLISLWPLPRSYNPQNQISVRFKIQSSSGAGKS